MSDRPNDWVVPENGESTLDDPYENETTGEASGSTDSAGSSSQQTASDGDGAELGKGFNRFDQGTTGGTSGGSVSMGDSYGDDFNEFDDMGELDAGSSGNFSSTWIWVAIAVIWVFFSLCAEWL